jgi:hypothetical protein
MCLEGNALKSAELTVGFSFTTTLHYTSRFWSRTFLANKTVKALEHSPHSPDLFPADCYLLPGLKSALNGRSFCDAPTLNKNTTKELKRISQNGF